MKSLSEREYSPMRFVEKQLLLVSGASGALLQTRLPLAQVCSNWAGLWHVQLLQNLTCIFQGWERLGATFPALSTEVEGALPCTIHPAPDQHITSPDHESGISNWPQLCLTSLIPKLGGFFLRPSLSLKWSFLGAGNVSGLTLAEAPWETTNAFFSSSMSCSNFCWKN